MIPLVMCSLVAVTFILLRAVALRRRLVIPPVLEMAVADLTPGQSADRIANMAGGDPSSLARIMETALEHRSWPKSENMESVQTRARHEMVRLETGQVVLEVIIGIAPLLGLLGTVAGLVSVFGNLGGQGGEVDPQGIALGIAEALNTTIAGLAIAIPSLVGHSYFNKKIEVMAVDMESIVMSLLEKCYYVAPLNKSSKSPSPLPEIPSAPPASATRSYERPVERTKAPEPAKDPQDVPPLPRSFTPRRESPASSLQVRSKSFASVPRPLIDESPAETPSGIVEPAASAKAEDEKPEEPKSESKSEPAPEFSFDALSDDKPSTRD